MVIEARVPLPSLTHHRGRKSSGVLSRVVFAGMDHCRTCGARRFVGETRIEADAIAMDLARVPWNRIHSFHHIVLEVLDVADRIEPKEYVTLGYLGMLDLQCSSEA